MSKKEWKICTWIHHIATAAGLCIGLVNLFGNQKNRKKHGISWRQGALAVYLASQLWAALKIVVTLAAGKEYMKKSRENLHKICKGKKKEKTCVWGLTALSTGVKIGLPVLLG